MRFLYQIALEFSCVVVAAAVLLCTKVSSPSGLWSVSHVLARLECAILKCP